MSPSALSLSVKGLANIPEYRNRNDFCFVVGDRHYPCPWYVADFLSPLICRLHASDPSIDHFIVETRDDDEHFDELLRLGRGAAIELRADNCQFIWSIGQEFDNQELLVQAGTSICEDLTVANAVDNLLLFRAYDAPIDPIIEFIASHFTEFPSDFSTALSGDDVAMIIAHPSLELRNEDDLFDLVACRLRQDPTSFSLFEHVRFEYCSKESVTEFSELVADYFDRFNVAIWWQIRPCLVQGALEGMSGERQGRGAVGNHQTVSLASLSCDDLDLSSDGYDDRDRLSDSPVEHLDEVTQKRDAPLHTPLNGLRRSASTDFDDDVFGAE
jgi:hypothetical protein